LGEEEMIRLMKSYYKKYKFTHPRGEDFIALAKSFIEDNNHSLAFGDLDFFFDQMIYGTDILDYSVNNISFYQPIEGLGFYDKGAEKVFETGTSSEEIYSQVRLHRLGGMIVPVELRVEFEDGSVVDTVWSGKERSIQFVFLNKERVKSAYLDPEQKLYLDLNLNNNSLSLQADKAPVLKIASKVMYWVQNIIQTVGIII